MYFKNDKCVVVQDKYPKAKLHYLLLPRPSFLDCQGITALRHKDLAAIRCVCM